MANVKHAWRAAALAAALLVAPAVSNADIIVVIEGELTENDFLAQDSSGTFYYDIFDFVSVGTDPITMTLSSGDFVPFYAYSLGNPLPPWPTGSDEPYYGSPPDIDPWFQDYVCVLGTDPGSEILTFANPTAGQNFQVMVSTCFYNEQETPLGSYTLTIASNPTSVPEPGSLALFGIGLVGLALARRRKRLY